MGLLDRLFGSDPRRPGAPETRERPADSERPDDARAVERYRYLVRTAPPDQVEQAHAEAFAQLTPEQRREVLRRFGEELPPGEATASADDPRALARLATRAELRRPGFLERTLGPGTGGGLLGGGGLGASLGGSLLASLAGSFIGSAIGSHLWHGLGGGFTEGGIPPGAADVMGDAGADGGGFDDVTAGHGTDTLGDDRLAGGDDVLDDPDALTDDDLGLDDGASEDLGGGFDDVQV